MTIREKILSDLKEIKDPSVLHQVFEFMQLLLRSRRFHTPASNRSKVLSFAGILDSSEAEQMKKDINEAFDHLEGEW